MNSTVIKVPRSKLFETTIRVMKDLAWANRNAPEIKEATVRAVNSAGVMDGRDHQRIAETLAKWIGNNIAYWNDPHHGETVQKPQVTLDLKYGDCDDMATLLAAMLMSAGIPARFRVVGNSRPQHVFVEGLTPAGWYGLDPVALPTDPTPDQLKTFLVEGFDNNSRKGKKTMNNFTIGLGNGGETPYEYSIGRTGPTHYARRNRAVSDAKAIKEQIASGRPRDPITRTGTLLEQSIHAPVILKVTPPKKHGGEHGVKIAPLYNVSPLDVIRYKKDSVRGIIYPELVPPAQRGGEQPTYFDMNAIETGTYEQALATNNVDDLIGVAGLGEFVEMGGLLSIAKKALKGAKKLVFRPVKTLKTFKSNLAAKRAQKDVLTALKDSPGGGSAVKTLSPDKFAQVSKLLGDAVAGGKIPPDLAASLQQQMATGDLDTAINTLRTTDPDLLRQAGFTTGAGLPSWVLPAAGVATVFYILKKKK